VARLKAKSSVEDFRGRQLAGGAFAGRLLLVRKPCGIDQQQIGLVEGIAFPREPSVRREMHNRVVERSALQPLQRGVLEAKYLSARPVFAKPEQRDIEVREKSLFGQVLASGHDKAEKAFRSRARRLPQNQVKVYSECK
jgi:hypothetical protein